MNNLKAMCDLFVESVKMTSKFNRLVDFDSTSIHQDVYDSSQNTSVLIARVIARDFKREDVEAYLNMFSKEEFRRDNEDVEIADSYFELYNEWSQDYKALLKALLESK